MARSMPAQANWFFYLELDIRENNIKIFKKAKSLAIELSGQFKKSDQLEHASKKNLKGLAYEI